MVKSLDNVKQIRWAINARHQLYDWYVGTASYVDTISTNEAELEYRKKLAQIPPGNKVLIALDFPFLLNYRTHSNS